MSLDTKIGISAKFHHTAPVFYGVANRHIQFLETSIARWVAQNHALPLMIPSESEGSKISSRMLDAGGYARCLDGLILQGGVDVHPTLYDPHYTAKKDYTYDLVRDRYELELIKAFLNEKKPIFGICRGLQLLNVHFGGTLHHDLGDEGYSKHFDPTSANHHLHEVSIMPNGLLSQIYPSTVRVTSIHHQGINLLGTDCHPEAHASDDGLIEAFSQASDESFVLAVQWHPEFDELPNQCAVNSNLLVRQFVQVANVRRISGRLDVSAFTPNKSEY